MRSGKLAREWPWLIVIALMALTLLLRAWDLDRLPPWLWFDEAGNGLDARELWGGQFRLFFSRSFGKEPLYMYLAAPFVAAWDGAPFAVRLPAALSGALMIPALYAAGRMLWREDRRSGIWAGLTAAGLWTINYWPQNVNRIGFRVNTLPLLLTLAVVTWLLWTHRPGRRRALTFGLLAGLTLYTYLAARITLLLWPLLFLTLPVRKKQALSPTLRWAGLAFALTVAPLAGHFAYHPEAAVLRVGTVTALVGPQGVVDRAVLLGDSLLKVLGGFLGWAGDPLLRHNLPGRPPFALPLAVMFLLGVGVLLAGLFRRGQRSWTLIGWWGVMILPAVFAAEGNPHSLRLFGALPAALLIAVTPLAWAIGQGSGRDQQPRPWQRAGLLGLLAFLLLAFGVGEGARTVRAYFVEWPRSSDLYEEFQGDIWSYGAQVQKAPGTLGIVSRSSFFYILDYAFRPARFLQVSVAENEIEADLARAAQDLSHARLAVPAWRAGLLLDTDPKEVLPFYLAREGILEARVPYRGFDLLSFQMGAAPQFGTVGRKVAPDIAFHGGLHLQEARWGVAYPNEGRDGDAAAAGTSVWVVLTWQGPAADLAPLAADLKAAVDVVDQQGHRLASDERPLLDAQHLPATRWGAAVTARSYHLVTIPPTQLPGPVQLQIRAYETASLTPVWALGQATPLAVELASVQVTGNAVPVAVETLPINRRLDLQVAPGITLLGLAPWAENVAPGQVLTLRAFWQVAAASDAQELALELASVRQVPTLSIQTVARLPGRLPERRVVHTDLDLRLPAEILPGVYELRLAGAPLGEVMIAGRARQFQAPVLWLPAQATFGDVVALLGVDVPEAMRVEPANLRVVAGQVVRFTLAWQAYRASDRDLKRFVHLVDAEGHPLAQQDVTPCSGACAAPSWLSNEILVEEAAMGVPPGLAPGRYHLVVGWYDPASLIRLPAHDASGGALREDVMPLPLTVDVTS